MSRQTYTNGRHIDIHTWTDIERGGNSMVIDIKEQEELDLESMLTEIEIYLTEIEIYLDSI